jgi:MtN3 and saliva related transmembrane protein
MQFRRPRYEQLMIIVGLVSPIATIPQVIKIFATHPQHAAGQSLITWTVYTVLGALWVIYGVHHREWPLIIGNIAGVIMYGLVVVGILRNAGFTF